MGRSCFGLGASRGLHRSGQLVSKHWSLSELSRQSSQELQVDAATRALQRLGSIAHDMSMTGSAACVANHPAARMLFAARSDELAMQGVRIASIGLGSMVIRLASATCPPLAASALPVSKPLDFVDRSNSRPRPARFTRASPCAAVGVS